jgi:general secretion pathway protein K
VLIAAIWLLILAGSIVAVLMLRSLAASTAAADRSEAVERRLAMESAIETLLADRLFNGNRSAWWRAPAEGAIAVGGRDVRLRMTSESGRLDVNNADLALVDGALRGLGLGADERGPIVTRLQALRAMKRNIRSAAELDQLTAGVRPRPAFCIGDQLTWVSGLAEPRPDQMPPALARALAGRGGAAAGAGPGEVEAGAALRIEATDAGGAAMIAIVRLTGLAERPIEASAWAAPPACRRGPGT